jgi:hypothetical protein
MAPSLVRPRRLAQSTSSSVSRSLNHRAHLGIVLSSPTQLKRHARSIGDLRFRLPRPNAPYTGEINATAFGLACLQQNSTVDVPTNLSPIALMIIGEETSTPVPDSEDCTKVKICGCDLFLIICG